MSIILTTNNNGFTRTVADVLTSSDGTLSDISRTAYTQPERIGFINDALQAIRNMRPDIFVGQYNNNPTVANPTDVLPIDNQFFRPIVDYVIARCETKDETHVVSGRVDLMARLMTGYLV